MGSVRPAAVSTASIRVLRHSRARYGNDGASRLRQAASLPQRLHHSVAKTSKDGGWKERNGFRLTDKYATEIANLGPWR